MSRPRDHGDFFTRLCGVSRPVYNILLCSPILHFVLYMPGRGGDFRGGVGHAVEAGVAFGICGRITISSRMGHRDGCFTARRPAIPITRPASGTSPRRCFTRWQTTTTSASTICWDEPAGKSRTLNNNRPGMADFFTAAGDFSCSPIYILF